MFSIALARMMKEIEELKGEIERLHELTHAKDEEIDRLRNILSRIPFPYSAHAETVSLSIHREQEISRLREEIDKLNQYIDKLNQHIDCIYEVNKAEREIREKQLRMELNK